MMLGLGWSATMVAGSTLLSESISGELRASAQGLSDLVMGLAGAFGRRDFRGGRGGVGVPHPDSAGRARDGAAARTGDRLEGSA